MRKPKDEFRKMMDLCCREIPTALDRNGRRVGNDFSVKELVFCLLEIEKAGIKTDAVSPKLLPNYTKHKNI